MSWFSYKRLSLKVHISPIFLDSVYEGIRIQLRNKLFRWISELEGVFLAWKEVSILSSAVPYSGDVVPLIEVPVSIKALVWCPEVGGIIQGDLAHKGADFVAARVLGLWNAVIVKSQYDYLDLSQVHEGDRIQFRIKNLQIVNSLLSIEGTLLGENVGIMKSDGGDLHFPRLHHAAVDAPPQVISQNKKKRPRPTDLSEISDGPSEEISTPLASSKKKKPKLAETSDDKKSEKKDKHKSSKDKHKHKHKSSHSKKD